MSLTYGFYNSMNGDRKYNANHLNTMFDGVIQDGVFQTIGNTFAVAPGTGLNVTIDTGKAWLHNTWAWNKEITTLGPFDPVATSGRSRIDAIVIEVNKNDRQTRFAIVKGTESGTPAKPALTNVHTDESEIYQTPIAWVTLAYGDTSISGSSIENNVGKTYDPETSALVSCPYVLGAMQRFSVDQIMAQFEAAFNEWFENLQNQLDTNQAAHLQHEIDELISSGTTPLTSETSLVSGRVYFQYEE